MLRKTIYAVLILVPGVLALGAQVLGVEVASAQADKPGISGYSPMRDQKERKNDREVDSAYQSAIKRLPGTQPKNSDPWSDVRPDPPVAGKNKRQ
jgi:hypothetical protein